MQVDHSFHIVDEFNIVLVDKYHKFHTHCIGNDFIFVLVEKDDKFHLYDNQNKLSILLPFPPCEIDKVEYGHIQYIIWVSLNSWMSLSVMTSISSLSSSLKDVASYVSLSFKTIKSTPFFKISSLCSALHFQPFLSLEARKLKFFINCFVSSLIALECLHFNKVILFTVSNMPIHIIFLRAL